MSKHKQFGPRSTGVRGLEIERQGSWIEKETRQEKKRQEQENYFLHRTQERGMKYKTNKSKK